MHAPSAEVPLAYTAGALLTRIYTASPVLFSIADDVLLLREFVGREQNCLYLMPALSHGKVRAPNSGLILEFCLLPTPLYWTMRNTGYLYLPQLYSFLRCTFEHVSL